MSMPRSAAVDGFGLAYDRHGAGDPVVLLHGLAR
jgi:pimeloyl-ACP methyl ester carboxylesterase